MKKIFLSLLLTLLLYGHINAQSGSGAIPASSGDRPKKKFGERLFGGGDLSLQFGDITAIYVSPMIGYKITPKLGAGIGPIYSYYKDTRYTPTYESSTYGGRIFGQYAITRNILAYTEYQQVNADVWDDFSYREIRTDIPYWFLGGGYLAPIGERSGIMIMVLFDLIDDRYSYYSNPIFRFGFTTGF